MPDVTLAEATGCDNDHLEPRWAVVELTMLDTTSLDAVTSLCAECWALGMGEFLNGLADEPARYEVRGVRRPTDEELQDDLAARVPEAPYQYQADYEEIIRHFGRRDARTAVPGLMSERVQVLLIEHQQYLDAFSHSQQLREHYHDMLSKVRRLIGPVGDSNCGTAVEMIDDALRNPPEWDHKPRR